MQAAASHALAALIDEARPILQRYRDHKRASAQLDFDDLIFAARDLLRDHDAVRQAREQGEVPAAFIELKAGAQCTEAEIIEHCRAHLARFKVPKQVVFGELPKTSTGKIQKYVLRQHANSALAIE